MRMPMFAFHACARTLCCYVCNHFDKVMCTLEFLWYLCLCLGAPSSVPSQSLCSVELYWRRPVSCRTEAEVQRCSTSKKQNTDYVSLTLDGLRGEIDLVVAAVDGGCGTDRTDRALRAHCCFIRWMVALSEVLHP